MKKVITESQIRFIVRNELKNHLIEEGLWDTITKGASEIGTKLSAAVKQTGQQIAEPWKKPQAPTGEFGEINNVIKKLSEDIGQQISSDFVGQIYNTLFKKENNKHVYAADSGNETQNFASIMNKLKQDYSTFMGQINQQRSSGGSKFTLQEKKKTQPQQQNQPQQNKDLVAAAKEKFASYITDIDSQIVAAKTNKQVKKLLLFSLLKYFIQICIVSFDKTTDKTFITPLADAFIKHVTDLKNNATTTTSTTPSTGTSPTSTP